MYIQIQAADVFSLPLHTHTHTHFNTNNFAGNTKQTRTITSICVFDKVFKVYPHQLIQWKNAIFPITVAHPEISAGRGRLNRPIDVFT